MSIELNVVPPTNNGSSEASDSDNPLAEPPIKSPTTESAPRSTVTTAQQYAARVDSHSRTGYNSLYAGLNYAQLAKFLRPGGSTYHPAHNPQPLAQSVEPKQDLFAILYELEPEQSPKAIPLSLPDPLGLSLPDLTHNSIIFLRGYPSPKWLTEIGAKYSVDPDFFHRHMSYLRSEAQCDRITPHSPPSFCRTTFQTTITSIGSVSMGFSDQHDLETLRAMSRRKMLNYLKTLRVGADWNCCHSVVRSFSMLDRNHCSFDQAITIHLEGPDKKTGRWLALVWVDFAEDLCKSPNGPWSDMLGDGLTAHIQPISLYKPRISFRRHLVKDTEIYGSAMSTHSLPQNISILAKHYGQTLNSGAMCGDPFYALNEVFATVCASKVQFLDLLTTKIDNTVNELQLGDGYYTSTPQSNLIYYRRAIELQNEAVSEIISFLRHKESLDWPRIRAEKVETASTRLQHDFEYILESGKQLQERCEREMNVMMNAASIEEARRSISESKRLFKLTVLASVYIPVSFSCSVFGMNFIEFSTPTRGYWVWTAFTIPIFLLSPFVLGWDTKYMQRIRQCISSPKTV